MKTRDIVRAIQNAEGKLVNKLNGFGKLREVVSIGDHEVLFKINLKGENVGIEYRIKGVIYKCINELSKLIFKLRKESVLYFTNTIKNEGTVFFCNVAKKWQARYKSKYIGSFIDESMARTALKNKQSQMFKEENPELFKNK